MDTNKVNVKLFIFVGSLYLVQFHFQSKRKPREMIEISESVKIYPRKGWSFKSKNIGKSNFFKVKLITAYPNELINMVMVCLKKQRQILQHNYF